MATRSQDKPAAASAPDAREAYLVVRDGKAWRDVYRLTTQTVTTIGRDPFNRVVLQDDQCSRRHCDVYLEATDWLVRDLHSSNGTLVNGLRISEMQALNDGDLVHVGRSELLFTTDLTQPLERFDEGGSGVNLSETDQGEEDDEPQILQRKSKTRYVTETAPKPGRREAGVREALAQLYPLVVRMVSCGSLRAICETALDGLLQSVNADIGAVLLFAEDTDHQNDPQHLRIMAYRGPESAPYRKVSRRLSQLVLSEKQGIVAADIRDSSSTDFKTLALLKAESVICAPIHSAEQIFGLFHLYSLDADEALQAEALDFALAVADQTAVALENLRQKESLTSGLQNAQDQNQSLRQLLEIESDLVGDSPKLDEVRDIIARVASSDVTALVRGESGVGKELVARAIHFNSTRRKGPFVCLNCAALTETLLESELFGHEKGSFTGAVARKIGKFEQADGGTLFLDEVGEMPPAIQAKFLRVLEGHPFERIGGSSTVQVDVRVVAATNRDLEAAVRDGEFRNDLFYRLQILEINVPPLREHADDIPALASHFLFRSCQRLGRPTASFSAAAIDTLCNHDWPGNVRELRNVIERTVVMADGPEIQPADIRFTPGGSPPPAADSKFESEPMSLEAVERKHIAFMLDQTGWKKGEAAKLLGINRSTLDRKLQRYGIEPPASS